MGVKYMLWRLHVFSDLSCLFQVCVFQPVTLLQLWRQEIIWRVTLPMEGTRPSSTILTVIMWPVSMGPPSVQNWTSLTATSPATGTMIPAVLSLFYHFFFFIALVLWCFNLQRNDQSCSFPPLISWDVLYSGTDIISQQYSARAWMSVL